MLYAKPLEHIILTPGQAVVSLERGDTVQVTMPNLQSHISNIKSFLPVRAEISVTKVFITANMKNSKSNRYLSFYWKKWFYIWYVALAWWLVPCVPFPGLLHIYFLFTVWLRINTVKQLCSIYDLQTMFRKTAQGNIFHPILFIYGAKCRSFKTRCCTLRRAKNTPTRSFVSNL
jgi:hypothetical protein